MNSIRSNNLSFKYHRFTPLCWKAIGIRNLSLLQELSSFRKVYFLLILGESLNKIYNKEAKMFWVLEGPEGGGADDADEPRPYLKNLHKIVYFTRAA